MVKLWLSVVYSNLSTTPTGDQFTQLLETIQTKQARMDKPLKAKLQEDATSMAFKHVQHKKAYVFKCIGSEKQASLNEQVKEVVADTQAELAMAGTAPAMERAKAAEMFAAARWAAEANPDHRFLGVWLGRRIRVYHKKIN